MQKNSEDRVYYKLRTHLEMLNDRVRCLSYQKAIQSVVQDKIVLDVGCGTGILSFFAAQAGAKFVFAVDTDIPPGADLVLRANGLANQVQFIQGRIQDIDLPVDSVDIIISEWMGGLLLMEDMLPVVLYARDRWLKPGGLLLPDQARLFLAPLDDVAGISSEHFPLVRETIASQMWVSMVDPSRFLAEPDLLLDLNLYTTTVAGAREYSSEIRHKIYKTGTLNGFGLWFDVIFNEAESPVLLSTAPWSPPTHWAQGLWILPKDINVRENDHVSGVFAQTKISPSSASFSSTISIQPVNSQKKEIVTKDSEMEASPSNMSTTGNNDQQIAEKAISGAYQGKDCFWIGCSISFGALMAARNGATSVTILNHSAWAAKAMKQLAQQEGLSNVNFVSAMPGKKLLENRDIHLLGTVDGSWNALISHIIIRQLLKQTDFSITFSWSESPWKKFYGFDFSSYAPYDLEMIHQEHRMIQFDQSIALEEIQEQQISNDTVSPETIIYRGTAETCNLTGLYITNGEYNRMNIDFSCGTVTLPLPEALSIDSSHGKLLQKIKVKISIVEETLCRFVINLSGPVKTIKQRYEQPLLSMGHIVRNQ